MTTDYDVLIVGAGAAGLAAARHLSEAGRRVLALEARHRIGGRIHTDRTWAGIPVELGAEFIHGDSAPTHALVRQAGLTTIPVVRMGNLWWAAAEQAATPRADLPPALKTQLEALLADYHTLADIPLEHDVSLAAYLRQRGWNEGALRMADVLLAQTCCARLDALSCADLKREMRLDRAGDGEARITQGYGALLDWYAHGLNLRLNCAVLEIARTTAGLVVTTTGGTFTSRAAIITLPPVLLHEGAIHFDPPLSAERREACAALPTEAATKLIYRFDERLWDAGLTYVAHDGPVARWWTPAYGRGEAALMSAFITADRAQVIDALPETDALTLGLRDLAQLLGLPVSQLQGRCVAAQRVAWAADPLARGGYAHVPPGAADARQALAQPEANGLFFAGEATAHDTNPQTVHGALESGWRAAREADHALT